MSAGAHPGGASVNELFGRTGELAPMTPVGSGMAVEPVQPGQRPRSRRARRLIRRATRQRHERIHNIFRRLLRIAKSANYRVPEGGADLRPLANAVQRWLDARAGRMTDTTSLESAEGRLVAELIGLLERYHG